MTIRLALVGLVTLLGQVVLLREIVVASYGSELIYLLAIGIQLLGTVAGVLAGRHEARDSGLRLRALFFAYALLLPALVAFARAMRIVFGAVPGAYLGFGQQMAGIALALVPLGMSGGLLFAAAARTYVAGGKTLAAAYAIESAGSLAGGAMSTLFVAWGIQNLSAALLCAIFAALAAAIGPEDDRHRRLAGVAWVVVIALAAAADSSTRIDRAMTSWTHPSLLDTRDTPYGRATVTGSHGQVAVFENDALAFESEGTSAEELVHLAALEVAEPRSIFVLGGAVEGVVTEARKHRPEKIEDVELDRRMIELAMRRLPRSAPYALRVPGTRLTYADPRRALERSGQHDLILSAMPEPDSGQTSRYYTKEFFALCASHLEPGGVFAFRLRSSENLWTPALARRLASIDGALRTAFADVIVLPGTANLVIASNGRLVRDPDILAARFRERGIEARLVSPRYIRYLLTNDRTAEIAELVARTPAPTNSDARPVCYRYTQMLWLARFYPQIALDESAGFDARRTLAAALAIALAAALLARRSIAVRRAALVAVAGFAGMVLECALILGYQTGSGALYQDVGLLLAMFMAGLTGGSWLVNVFATGRHAEAMRSQHGVALLVAIALLACLAASRFVSPQPPGLPAVTLLLLGAGLLTGGLFAFASLWRVESQGTVIAPLYAADLVGGCAGSLVASLVLIPLAGLPLTLLLVGAAAILATTLL